MATKEYCEERAWAKANAGRRVRTVRYSVGAESGLVGTVIAFRSLCGYPFMHSPDCAMGIEANELQFFCSSPGTNERGVIPGFYARIEDLDFLDGRPALESHHVDTPHGAVVTPAGNRAANAVKPQPLNVSAVKSTLPEQLKALQELLSGTPQPWTARLTGPRGYVEVNLSALIDVHDSSQRALSFLSGLFLTDHPIETQRELLAVVRALQAAVKK